MQEDKLRLVESELKEIESLKNELDGEAMALQEEKNSLQLKRDEMEDRLRQITEVLEGKSIRFITKEDAKLCELNMIARFDTKMQDFPLNVHSPIDDKKYEIRSWDQESHVRFTEGSSSDTPSNARSQYVIAERKHGFFGEKIKKIVVEAVELSHVKEFEEYGFDTRRANLSEFLGLITRFIDSAEIGKYFHVIGISSPTGWDERVKDAIASTDFAQSYVSRYVSICLVDSVTGEVIYNQADERIKGFVEFFEPQFDGERIEKVKNLIINGLTKKDYVVYEDIAEETHEERKFLNKAFHDIDKEKKGKLRHIKNVGLVIEAA